MSFVSGCLAFSKELKYRDENVEIYEQPSRLPHTGDQRTLVVKGKTFGRLYSYRYALISEWNSIVFVTYREGYKYKVHIFDLKSKVDNTIDLEDSFGGSLGQPKDIYLKSVHGDVAEFVKQGFKAPDTIYKLNRFAKAMNVAQKSPTETSE